MKRSFLLTVLLAAPLAAQMETRELGFQVAVGGGVGMAMSSSARPIQGAPYSATVTNESIQTLADGNRIVQSSTGTVARDSMGRTRNDAPLPKIGNMTAAAAPHLAFIADPVAQASYTLNLDDKTAHTMPSKGMMAFADDTASAKMKIVSGGPKLDAEVPMAAMPQAVGAGGAFVSAMAIKGDFAKESTESKTEDLGMQVIEGVSAQGTRTTRTIPAGEIGNDKPIDIVTEVWTSPDLKTIVLSKRSDPRMGEQTFRLTNIVRTEPDASLFTVPSDFKVLDAGHAGQNVIFYKQQQ